MEGETRTGGRDVSGKDDGVVRVGTVGEFASERGGPESCNLGGVAASTLAPNSVLLLMVVSPDGGSSGGLDGGSAAVHGDGGAGDVAGAG